MRDGAFTNAYGDVFFGSQSFRSPKSTTYNITLAAAAGGRGLCNVEFGRGLVVNTTLNLTTSIDYLIVVGQKGLGPCDAQNIDTPVFRALCESPPTDVESSNKCRQNYEDWVRNQTDLDYERTLLLSGGAGGGGASFFRRDDKKLQGYASLFSISGGGGGTAALLDYSALDDLVRGTSHRNVTLYKSFINASASKSNPNIANNFALNGYRVHVEPPEVTAGAGGGLFSNASSMVNTQDGGPASTTEEFAKGGLHCVRNDVAMIPMELRWGNGGFGGGGAGCGGGGGGGGVTGGPVLAAGNTVPGGGGYTSVASSKVMSYNEGEGYVDIVEADCGCVYQCEVFEEDDQFLCLCPNDTQLAPDLSDCFFSK